MGGTRDLYTLTQSVQGWRKPALPITRSSLKSAGAEECASSPCGKGFISLISASAWCVSQSPLLDSKCPCFGKLQLSLPAGFVRNKYKYLARPVWWEKRGSASFSTFVLRVWIWGTEQVFGGTWARETAEFYCLGTSVSGVTKKLPLQLTGSYF